MELKPDPKRRKSWWTHLPRLPIPDREYIRLILHLRATGLVEFNGERDVSAIRLSAAGEEWARGERLLPKLKKHDSANPTDRLSNKDDTEVPSS